MQFGDQRLTKRLVRVVEALGSRPHDSIPAATATRAELEGAYRFFGNEKVTPELILSKHIESNRWIEGVRQARDVAEECPDTTWICIADSEGDIFERILLLCRLGQECPDMPCDVVFNASEWKAVYMVRHRLELIRTRKNQPNPQIFSAPEKMCGTMRGDAPGFHIVPRCGKPRLQRDPG